MKSKDSVRYFSFIGYNYMFWLADIFSQPQVSTRVQVYNMYKWVLILLVMKMCFANYIYILLAHFHSILLLCSTSSCLFPYSDIWALPNDTMIIKFTRHGKLLPHWIPVVSLKEEQDLQMCTRLCGHFCISVNCILFRAVSPGMEILWQKWCFSSTQLNLVRHARISDCWHQKVREQTCFERVKPFFLALHFPDILCTQKWDQDQKLEELLFTQPATEWFGLEGTQRSSTSMP